MKDAIKIICAIAILFALVYGLATMEQWGKAEQPAVDVSTFERWIYGYGEGTVRAVVGEYYSTDEDGYITICDENGNLWGIYDYEYPINEHHFIMLWIADNHTPDDVTDDIVVKVWVEAM